MTPGHAVPDGNEQEAENDLLREVEMLTLRRIAETQIAGQNELGEFYENHKKPGPGGPMRDLLFAFLETRQTPHAEKDRLARQLMSADERLIRCDLADAINSRPGIARDLRIHARMIERCGAVLLFSGESRLLIAGFNPTGIVRLRQWLGRCPTSSRVLPYVSAMWLASETYHRLSLARNGCG